VQSFSDKGIRRLDQATPSRQEGANQRGPKPWNTEGKESMALEAVTRRQPVKIQQTVKISCVM
jgi:hypothetical protein